MISFSMDYVMNIRPLFDFEHLSLLINMVPRIKNSGIKVICVPYELNSWHVLFFLQPLMTTTNEWFKQFQTLLL